MDNEMLIDRDEAERFPCRYELPGNRYQRRARSLAADDSSWRCGAEPGQHCRNPSSGAELTGQAAHLVRLRDAGRVPEPAPVDAGSSVSTSGS